MHVYILSTNPQLNYLRIVTIIAAQKNGMRCIETDMYPWTLEKWIASNFINGICTFQKLSSVCGVKSRYDYPYPGSLVRLFLPRNVIKDIGPVILRISEQRLQLVFGLFGDMILTCNLPPIIWGFFNCGFPKTRFDL